MSYLDHFANASNKGNYREPPEGAAGARALGGWRIGERSEPRSPTTCDRSEGGRGDAGLGMRENSECIRCFSRMRKTAYRQAIRVISSNQRASKVAPKRVIKGSPPRGRREQGRLGDGGVAREASRGARHHATEARAGGGMRDWA